MSEIEIQRLTDQMILLIACTTVRIRTDLIKVHVGCDRMNGHFQQCISDYNKDSTEFPGLGWEGICYSDENTKPSNHKLLEANITLKRTVGIIMCVDYARIDLLQWIMLESTSCSGLCSNQPLAVHLRLEYVRDAPLDIQGGRHLGRGDNFSYVWGSELLSPINHFRFQWLGTIRSFIFSSF